MYHQLELSYMSVPKPGTSKGNRITVIGMEKHWDPAEKTRLSPKWSSADKIEGFLAELHLEEEFHPTRGSGF
jgi:hypothetical protein